MSSIDYLNEFLNSSLPFPFYQRLNPLLMGYPMTTPLYQVVEAFWRAGPAAPGQVHGPQRAKMLRPIDKGVSLLDIPLNNGFKR